MNEPVLLDSGPLGRIAHPRRNLEIVSWLEATMDADIPVILPEIADYEVRRSFLLENLTRSIERLDALKATLIYLPLTTDTLLQAAEFWAEGRRRGRPTADPRELDGDVILAAQAHQVGGIVITENVGHLSLFVEARSWRDSAD